MAEDGSVWCTETSVGVMVMVEAIPSKETGRGGGCAHSQ